MLAALLDVLEHDATWVGAAARFSCGAAAAGLAVLAFLLLWRQVAWMREPAWIRNAPTVPGLSLAAAVSGTVLEFVQQGRICRTFMHADQPDILRFNNGLAGGIFRDFVMIKDAKIAREILEEPNTCKPERGYRAFRRLTGYKGSYDFLSSHSHKDPLYARTRLVAYETLMDRTVKYYDSLFLDTVTRVVDRCAAAGTFDVVHEMHAVATSLITSVGFDEQSDKLDQDLFDAAVWIVGDMIARPQNNSLKFLDWLPTPRNFELRRRQNILIRTIETMIQHKRQKPGDDVISKLLTNSLNSDADLLGVLSIFFFAGFDTTSNTMSMVLYHLATNPDVQERARADVFSVLGRRNAPQLHKLQHMRYLGAVISETLRMFPTVPMVTREVTEHHADGVCPRFKEESTFGTVINFFGLHYNPRGWNRPEEFLPERWLDPSVDADRDPEQRLYCPFALGKRACLGRQFAKIEMLTVIACVLQRFHVSLPPGQKAQGTVHIHEGGTLVVDHDLRLRLDALDPDGRPPRAASEADDAAGRARRGLPPPVDEAQFSLDEVARHHSREDLWMVIDGGVYDITRYLKLDKGARHPGGVEILVAYGGADGTSEFDFIGHSKFARRLLARYRIGRLADADAPQLLQKEDATRHVLGQEASGARRRRTTVPVLAEGYGDAPPPLRNFKS